MSDSKELCLQLKRNAKATTSAAEHIFVKKNYDVVAKYLRASEQSASIRLKVKDFPADHTWFNVSEPLSMETHLKNKLVLIDFWTYCCINCLHTLPDIEYLADKFQGYRGIVFMGCHSAKFTNEKVAGKVREAILKYDVKYPVIND